MMTWDSDSSIKLNLCWKYENMFIWIFMLYSSFMFSYCQQRLSLIEESEEEEDDDMGFGLFD